MFGLLWRESQVTVNSQSTTSSNKSPPPQPSLPPPPPLPPPPNPPLYIAEDEMASWLNYPFEDICTELLYPNTNNPGSSTQAQPPQPPPSPPARPSRQLVVARSFQPFSNVEPHLPEQSNSPAGMTVVGSNDSPATVAGCRGGVGLRSGGGSGSVAYTSSSCATGSDMATATTETTKATTANAEDDIKKEEEGGGVVSNTDEGPSEDSELEVAAKKLKHADGSTSKRSRSAEVHNLSERRRRDRINEKMKALQELVPHSNKSDKASMLDDAIDYMKSLQLQVQMLSMNRGMVPMMYHGMQPQYVQPSGMGTSVVQAATSPQLPPMLPPATAYPMCPVPAPGFSVMRPNTLPNTTNSLVPFQNPGMPQYPNVANPYQPHMALQPMQMQPMPSQQLQVVQNSSPSQPTSSKTSSSVTGKEHDDKKDG